MIDLAKGVAHSFEPLLVGTRLQTLERIVLDLMMEIEALRAAVIELSSRAGPVRENAEVLDDAPAGVTGPHTAYGTAYLQTAWLTHWAAGVSSGSDKLLERFYSQERDGDSLKRPSWRELLLLRRLGYNDAQLEQYVASAQAAETCT